ncbi:LOW QUALITY PROTEIN: protein ABHD14A-like [Pangshura tecta]
MKSLETRLKNPLRACTASPSKLPPSPALGEGPHGDGKEDKSATPKALGERDSPGSALSQAPRARRAVLAAAGLGTSAEPFVRSCALSPSPLGGTRFGLQRGGAASLPQQRGWRRLSGAAQGERLAMALIRNRLGLLVLGVLVTFVLYLLLPAIQHERFTSRAGSHKAQARAEEKSQQDVNVTVLTGTIAGSPSILFREGFLLQRAGTPSPKRLEVIFLHGQAFTSKTWEDLGTLTLLSEEGYRSIAIDLPGYGNSPPSDAVSTEQGRVAFLQHVLKELGIQRPVLISPSMSGRYSIPFVLVHGAQLKGFVPIAPVGTQDYTSQQYQQVQTPTLIVYGERDTGLGAQSLQSLQQLPKHKTVALPDAGHACYLEKPREFHEALLAFLGELQ